VIDFLVVIVVLFAVVVVVSAPLRRARRPELHGTTELAELEAAREAKYREIRDAELDHRTGKLSDADYGVLDQSLRAEAIEILRSIDRERERVGEPAEAAAASAE
jgi:type II secretory pathway component PulM